MWVPRGPGLPRQLLQHRVVSSVKISLAEISSLGQNKRLPSPLRTARLFASICTVRCNYKWEPGVSASAGSGCVCVCVLFLQPEVHPVSLQPASPSHQNCPRLCCIWGQIFQDVACHGEGGKGRTVSCSAPPDAKQTSREQSFGVHLWRFCTIRAARANNDPGSFTSRPELEPHAPGECCSAQPGAAAALAQPRRAVPRRVQRALCQHEHPNLAGGAGLPLARLPPAPSSCRWLQRQALLGHSSARCCCLRRGEACL